MRYASAILCALIAAPALADTSTLALPGTCRAYLTTQDDACVVAHFVTCSGDPAGQQTVVELYLDGGDNITVIDGDYQWLTTVDQLSGVVSTLGPEIADPGTLTQLIDDGEDTYDFTTTDADGTVTRFIGKESLTGQTLTVDGVTLEEAQNQMRALDSAGNELWRTNGTEYVSREWRIFFSGPGMTTLPNESFPTNRTPVEFIFPGEPGFLSTQPTTGCPG
jgi:hypothetical protein